MGDSPKQPVKLYYRIGEVAEIVGVEPHVLRYWETEFRTIRPQKSRKGQRVYNRRDVEKLLRVKDLLYTQGFTIAGARKRLRDGATEAAPAAAAASAATAAAPPQPVPTKMRQALLALREDVVTMLGELDGDSGRRASGH